MFTSITWFLTSSVVTDWQADGALSRRQPGEVKQGSGPIVGSRNVSQRTDVSWTPQVVEGLTPCLTPNPATMLTVRLKLPEQPAPFWSQNWMPAPAPLAAPAPLRPSLGAFSSFESRLLLASFL